MTSRHLQTAILGIAMLCALYGGFYRQIRRLSDPSMRAFWFSLLLFVIVRGLTDTEPFDLSLPLWALVMISVLMAEVRASSSKESGHNLTESVPMAAPPQAVPTNP